MREQLERIASEIEAFSQCKVTEGRLLRWAAEIRAAIEREQPRVWRNFDPLAPLVIQRPIRRASACAGGPDQPSVA